MDLLDPNLFSHFALCTDVPLSGAPNCVTLTLCKIEGRSLMSMFPLLRQFFFPFSELSQAPCHTEAKFNGTFTDVPLVLNIVRLTRPRLAEMASSRRSL